MLLHSHIRLVLSKLLVPYSTAAVWWDRKGVAKIIATAYAATVSNARSTTKRAEVIPEDTLLWSTCKLSDHHAWPAWQTGSGLT